MSRKIRITAVGLLVGALTSGVVQALPAAVSGAHPSERADTLTTAIDRLASLLGWSSMHPDRRTDTSPNPASVNGLEKEGGVLDPNGHH
jgi:hypothetical protein